MINTTFKPFQKMIERLDTSKQESDSAFFYDLLFLGEMLTKTIVATFMAAIVDDKDRNRYRQLHKIVRADGIGEWGMALEDTLTGVSSQFLQTELRDIEKKDLTQKLEKGSWQYDCVENLFEVMKLVGLALPFKEMPLKTPAKNWFHHFATIRNGTKGHGATLPATCSKASLPLENSLKLFIENFFLFKREWVYLYQNMSGKYRVTNLNVASPNFDELKSDPSFVSKYPNGVYVFFDHRTNVELIYSNPEANDFLFPNGNFKEKNFELLSYITDKRLEGDSSKYLTPAEDLPSSETEGIGKLTVSGNCFINIPPLYDSYINRKGLEKELNEVLLEIDRYPIVTLKGIGGIGKTSLALSVLNQISQTNRFDLILWFSSRDIDLKPEGAKPVKNTILNEADIAIEFVNLLENKEAKSTKEKVTYLSQQMNKSGYGPILFVFDNFETVGNPAELFIWIDTYIRNPNKVLITSRTSRSFKADYPLEIFGMKEDECKELINETASNLGIKELITDKVIEQIVRESNGHPYVIKILLGDFAKDKKLTDVKRIVASKSDILTALFRRTYDWLSPSAKRVFLTLCSWRSAVPLIALEAVLLREANERIEVDDAVDELSKSSFIEVITSKEDEQIFLTVPLAASLFGKAELEVSPDKVAILLDRELLQEFGAAQHTDIANGIKPRIQRKFGIIANQISKGKADLESNRPTLEFISSKFPLGWVYLAKIYLENGDVDKAIHYLREYLKTDTVEDNKRQIWNLLADVYGYKDEWFNRVNALIEKCLLPNISLFEISETANEINRYFQEGKLDLDSEVKEKIILRVANLMASKMKDATAVDYSRLAWLYLHINDEDSALIMIRRGLEKDPENNYCRRLAIRLNLTNY